MATSGGCRGLVERGRRGTQVPELQVPPWTRGLRWWPELLAVASPWFRSVAAHVQPGKRVLSALLLPGLLALTAALWPRGGAGFSSGAPAASLGDTSARMPCPRRPRERKRRPPLPAPLRRPPWCLPRKRRVRVARALLGAGGSCPDCWRPVSGK